MSLEFWFVYILTIATASLIPGPSMLLALSHGMTYGARRTISSALGNVSASLIQAGISIAGLGAALMASHYLFLVIKWAGAFYLIYIGMRTFFSASGLAITDKPSGMSGLSRLKRFRIAFTVAMANPKAIMFFGALFPQFIDPSKNKIWQAAVLLGPLACVAFICFMTYAVFGLQLFHLFSGGAYRKIFNRVTGGAFVGSGLGILVFDK